MNQDIPNVWQWQPSYLILCHHCAVYIYLCLCSELYSQSSQLVVIVLLFGSEANGHTYSIKM